MAISQETLEKLNKMGPYACRAEVHAQAFIDQLLMNYQERRQRGEQVPPFRPAHKRLLTYLLCQKNTYTRVNSLVYYLSPENLQILDDRRELVDIPARNLLLTAMSQLRIHLRNSFLVIREIRIPGDRRIKAYGIFDQSEPDASQVYIERAVLTRLAQDYKK